MADSDKLQHAYGYYRKKVKNWEKKFFEKNKRKPDITDIKNADEDISETLKKYTKIKNFIEASRKSKAESKIELEKNSETQVKNPKSSPILGAESKDETNPECNQPEYSDVPPKLQLSPKPRTSFKRRNREKCHNHAGKLQSFFGSLAFDNIEKGVSSPAKDDKEEVPLNAERITSKKDSVLPRSSFSGSMETHDDDLGSFFNLEASKTKVVTSSWKNSNLTSKLEKKNSLLGLKLDSDWLDRCESDDQEKTPTASKESQCKAPPQSENSAGRMPMVEISPSPQIELKQDLPVKRKFDIIRENKPIGATFSHQSTDLDIPAKRQKLGPLDEQQQSETTSYKATGAVAKVSTKTSSVGREKENFVRINIKKKRFSKKKTSSSTFKKRDYKRKLSLKFRGNYKPTPFVEEAEFEDPNEMLKQTIPDTQESQSASSKKKLTKTKKSLERNHTDKEDMEDICEPFSASQALTASDRPSFCFSSEFSDDEVRALLGKFGHNSFRAGQEEAIKRILQGLSSLVVMSTGSGKSLIYQLPAYLLGEKFGCISIIVSPLISLMEDQLTGLPRFVRAAALHSGLTPKQKEKVMDRIKGDRLHFLLLSPEAVSGSTFDFLQKYLSQVAFVCIDEAHCISQWSYNFRPSYLRLCKAIREKLKVQTILGLTATAPERMIANVAQELDVASEGIISGQLLPSNLQLSVSREEDRDEALINMLSKGGAIGNMHSVIIYCTRRYECERLASFIRTKLRHENMESINGEVKSSVAYNSVEPYHAGLPASRRRSVQKQFMSGKIRIVIATVAFGMGINKADVRAIIHYNVPKSFESYVQEIGRAGRDGLPAKCHLFLCTDESDVHELKRHIFSNSIDKLTVKKLLRKIYPTVSSDASPKVSIEIALPVNELVEYLDIPKENILTLLCYLEKIDIVSCLTFKGQVYSKCKIQSYGGKRQLLDRAAKSPTLAAVLDEQKKSSEGFDLPIEFNYVNFSGRNAKKSLDTKRDLRNLEWDMVGDRWVKSGIIIEFTDLSLHMERMCCLSEEDLDELTDKLYQRAKYQENLELSNLQKLYRGLQVAAMNSDAGKGLEMSERIKDFIQHYFTVDDGEPSRTVPEPLERQTEEAVREDVRRIVVAYPDHTFTGRAVARIFQGIPSPNYPVEEWGRARRYWRSHLNLNFNLLVDVATDEVLKMRIRI